MKKIIGILVFLLLIFSAGIYYYMNQPKNICDEIYQETEKTYRLNNIFNKLTDVEVHSYQEYSDDSKFYPTILYKDIAKTGNYTKIAIDFSFLNKNNNILIYFEKEIGPNVRVRIWNKYTRQDRTLTKSVKIALEKGDSDKYIEDETQVRAYLKKYGITAKDLDAHYEKIVNQKVLKDWCSIYKSKYSPKDYGQVTVKMQWEKW